MLVGKNWKITGEGLNVVLSQKKKRTKKTTKETYEGWETLGYFRTVEGALHELLNQGVRDTELKDVKSIAKAIESLHDAIDTLQKASTALSRGIGSKVGSLGLTDKVKGVKNGEIQN